MQPTHTHRLSLRWCLPSCQRNGGTGLLRRLERISRVGVSTSTRISVELWCTLECKMKILTTGAIPVPAAPRLLLASSVLERFSWFGIYFLDLCAVDPRRRWSLTYAAVVSRNFTTETDLGLSSVELFRWLRAPQIQTELNMQVNTKTCFELVIHQIGGQISSKLVDQIHRNWRTNFSEIRGPIAVKLVD